ncbi:MAG: translational GTPase TypA, partial [Emcibacteraceae bacterium]|nr:translational GTPase TypA [Emcibacteraceae bacterium]
PYKGPIQGRRVGVLISMGMGKAVAYALFNLEDRGTIMVNVQEEVYEGMIIGEHARANDLDVNVLKGKQLTNVRASGKDDAIKLTPPKKLSLEQSIAYIQDDELLELTPESIRLRKRYLVPHERKKAARSAQA